jgi:outer membrane immunogenic protein
MRNKFSSLPIARLSVASLTASGLLILATALGAAQTAYGADMPVKAPPKLAPAPSWTGFYLDAGGGYGLWTGESFTSAIPAFGEPVAPATGVQGGRGSLGRFGGGFDYQFNSRIVGGVFADYDVSSLKGTIHDPAIPISAEIKQSSAWAVGGRAGWLINPSLMTYFTAGASHAHFTSGTMMVAMTGAFLGPAGVPIGLNTPAFSRSGWFLGGGAEVAVGAGWYARTEYRYAYYDDQLLTVTGLTPPPAGFTRTNDIHLKPSVQTVTASLVYKVNPGLPALAATEPAAPVVAARWSGLYANGGVGYGRWVADESTNLVPGGVNAPVVVTQRQGGKGWLGRVGGGYDHQFNGPIVAGVFADADFSSLKGSIQDIAAGLDGRTKETWSWAVGARAGWLVAPNVLTYVNGGYTETRFSGTTLILLGTGLPFFGLSTPAFTTDGWFFGGGMEAPIAPGWFWRNEYRFAQYDNSVVNDTSANPAAFLPRNTINFKPTVQTVTSAIVYKFSWGG